MVLSAMRTMPSYKRDRFPLGLPCHGTRYLGGNLSYDIERKAIRVSALTNSGASPSAGRN